MRNRENDRESFAVRPGVDRLTLAIAASRTVRPQWVIGPLTDLLNHLPPSLLLLRTGAHTNPGPVERMVFVLANFTGHEVRWCVPEEGRNRTGTYVRDVEMVQAADAVVALLHPDEDPLGTSGTAHILQKAIDANRTLFAYAAGPEGFEWIGSVDAPRSLTTLSDILSDKAQTALTRTRP